MEALPGLAPARPAMAGAAGAPVSRESAPRRPPAYRPRAPRATRSQRLVSLAAARGAGLALAALLLGGSFLYGAVRGGQFDAFTAEHGSAGDLAARALGFGLDTITISGSRDLYESEILQAAGVSAKNSLIFLNAAEIRERLMKVPLVRDASVRKLYPDRLLLEITEREPFALWQKDGAVMVISADGTAIEEVRDARFAELPFVVGAGANSRVAEFQKIVESAGDLRGKVRAGVLVSERRWNIRMTSGLDVKLPEKQPELAFASFARLARDSRLLDKDLISVDFRVPGRMYARMSEEPAAARAEALSRKKGKGGQT